MKFKSVLLVASLIAFGCHQNATLAEPRLMKTVNGEIYYFFNKEGEVGLACKEGYNNPDWSVMINRDSIRLGDNLVAMINVPKSTFNVTIDSPTKMNYTGGYRT